MVEVEAALGRPVEGSPARVQAEVNTVRAALEEGMLCAAAAGAVESGLGAAGYVGPLPRPPASVSSSTAALLAVLRTLHAKEDGGESDTLDRAVAVVAALCAFAAEAEERSEDAWYPCPPPPAQWAIAALEVMRTAASTCLQAACVDGCPVPAPAVPSFPFAGLLHRGSAAPLLACTRRLEAGREAGEALRNAFALDDEGQEGQEEEEEEALRLLVAVRTAGEGGDMVRLRTALSIGLDCPSLLPLARDELGTWLAELTDAGVREGPLCLLFASPAALLAAPLTAVREAIAHAAALVPSSPQAAALLASAIVWLAVADGQEAGQEVAAYPAGALLPSLHSGLAMLAGRERRERAHAALRTAMEGGAGLVDDGEGGLLCELCRVEVAGLRAAVEEGRAALASLAFEDGAPHPLVAALALASPLLAARSAALREGAEEWPAALAVINGAMEGLVPPPRDHYYYLTLQCLARAVEDASLEVTVRAGLHKDGAGLLAACTKARRVGEARGAAAAPGGPSPVFSPALAALLPLACTVAALRLAEARGDGEAALVAALAASACAPLPSFPVALAEVEAALTAEEVRAAIADLREGLATGRVGCVSLPVPPITGRSCPSAIDVLDTAGTDAGRLRGACARALEQPWAPTPALAALTSAALAILAAREGALLGAPPSNLLPFVHTLLPDGGLPVAPEAAEEAGTLARVLASAHAREGAAAFLAAALKLSSSTQLLRALDAVYATGAHCDPDGKAARLLPDAVAAAEAHARARGRCASALHLASPSALAAAVEVAQRAGLDEQESVYVECKAAWEAASRLQDRAALIVSRADSEGAASLLASSLPGAVSLALEEGLRRVAAMPAPSRLAAAVAHAHATGDPEGVAFITLALKSGLWSRSGELNSTFTLDSCPLLAPWPAFQDAVAAVGCVATRGAWQGEDGSGPRPVPWTSYSPHPLPTALSALPPALASAGPALSASLACLTGEVPCDAPLPLASALMDTALAHPHLADELFLQLMRHLIGNTGGPPSVGRALSVLSLLLAVAPPSPPLENVVEAFIRTHIPRVSLPALGGTQEEGPTVRRLLLALHRRLYLGPRETPSPEECALLLDDWCDEHQ